MEIQDARVVEDMYRAFARGDYGAALGYLSDDVDWDPGMPDVAARHGKQQVIDLFASWLGTWQDYRLDLMEVVGGSQGVVAVFRQRGTGRGSGVALDETHIGVHEVRDGHVATLRRFDTRREALEAAGAG